MNTSSTLKLSKRALNKLSHVARYSIASSPHAHPKTLARLDEDKSWRVRENIANNSSAPTETLAKLAEDEDETVRWNVAKNLSTPVKVLIKLSEDKKEKVKRGVYANPTYLQHRAVQDGICEVGQQMPVEWLKEMYLLQ